jgi:hypothetical protein
MQFPMAAKQIKKCCYVILDESRGACADRGLSRQTIPNIKMLFLARGGRLCEATRSAVEAAYSGEGMTMTGM